MTNVSRRASAPFSGNSSAMAKNAHAQAADRRQPDDSVNPEVRSRVQPRESRLCRFFGRVRVSLGARSPVALLLGRPNVHVALSCMPRMARVRSLICVNSGSSVAERSRAVRNGSITRSVRLRRSAMSLSRTPKLTRVRAAFQPCSIVVRPTYDTSAWASMVRDTRNAVLVRTLQPNVLAESAGSRLPALLRW